MPVAKTIPSASALLWLVLLAAIWVPVVYLLGAQWSNFEEYSYGWAVPCLCLFLAGQRFLSRPPATKPDWKKTALALLLATGLVFWIMRVLQEANPVWRVASYGLALAAVAMTLLAIYLTQGGRRAAHFLFPAAFFLVAVPWPTPAEGAVIQTLTRFNAGLAVEGLNFVGVPALSHGNVIEIGAGMVGIDEACSGIRSFQATLMIALFFGAFYQLHGARRWWLLGVGPALALAFNLTRTLVLVFVAARAGLPAMERWHDPTGEALLVGCFLCLWGVALWLGRRVEHPTSKGETAAADFSGFPNFSVSVLAIGLVVWALAVEISTEAWFRRHELRGARTFSWVARWPVDNPTFHTNIMFENTLRILQCDEHSSASWAGDDGVIWQAFYLRWLPADSFYGRVKVALSKAHNPAICLPASGMKMEAQFDPISLPVHPGFSLWFDRYVFADGDRKLFVFFSQTEDISGSGQASLRMTHLARLHAALAGSRSYGQNNFEVALVGPETPAAALRVFSDRLPELIETEPASP